MKKTVSLLLSLLLFVFVASSSMAADRTRGDQRAMNVQIDPTLRGSITTEEMVSLNDPEDYNAASVIRSRDAAVLSTKEYYSLIFSDAEDFKFE